LKTKYISLIVIFFIIVIFIIFSNRNNDTGRWYSEKQVKLGEQVFLKNCASCHGAKIGLNRTTMQELDRTQKRSLTGQ